MRKKRLMASFGLGPRAYPDRESVIFPKIRAFDDFADRRYVIPTLTRPIRLFPGT